MPFDLPDLPWWGWAIAAVGGAILSRFVAQFSEKNTGVSFLAVLMAVVSTMCGAMAIFEWVRGY
jgi:hypothetical protein